MTATDTAIAVTTLTIARLDDPVIEEHGHHVTSRYCEMFWLPTIGPSALWLLRHVSHHTADDDWTVDADTLGRSLGLGGSFSKHQPLHKTFDRLASFRCADGWGRTWRLRTHLPEISGRQLERLPDSLQHAHEIHRAAAG